VSIVKSWLGEFRSASTRTNYSYGLRHFVEAVKGDGEGWERWLEGYITHPPETSKLLEDFKVFLTAMEKRPPKTMITYAQGVRGFLADNGCPIPEEEWKKLRRRRQIRSVVLTQDKAPTHDELRAILRHLDVKGAALTLFLASSGCRIGETLQMKVEDLRLDDDPPQALIRPLTTKKGEGGRVVAMSYEARDAMKDWLNMMPGRRKAGGGTFEAGKVFGGIVEVTARGIFDRAVAEAGLETRDPTTGRRVIHIHSLRKFFRTNIGLDNDTTHALMGHKEYLDGAYLRKGLQDVMARYKRAMHNVSVFMGPSNSDDAAQAIRDLQERGILDQVLQRVGVRAMPGVQTNLQGGKVADQMIRIPGVPISSVSGETVMAPAGQPAGEPKKQQVVQQDQVADFLAKGWRFVATLNGKQAIVEK